MNATTITPVLPEYAHRAIARINARIRDDAIATGEARAEAKNSILAAQIINFGWRENGSAGKARDWFITAAENHPYDPYAALAELEAKAADEVASRPQWYSRGHVKGVIDIVREEVGL